MNAFGVIEDFEAAICKYTGAPYAVAVNSCTNALFLTLKWWREERDRPFRGGLVELVDWPTITIPRRTYVSVGMQIKHSLCDVAFEDLDWSGEYQLKPTPIWDCARRFTGGMYRPGTFMACSFHWTKILAIGHCGAILHDSPDADEWLRRARFDGRLPGEPPETATMIGWHCHARPEDAAEGLVRLASLPRDNPDSPKPVYPDLSLMEIFK